MKKTILFVFTLVCLGTNAQVVNIPDQHLKFLLLSGNVTSDEEGNSIALDINTDGEIQLTEAQMIYGIHLWPDLQHQISDLTGIGAFSNLSYLMIKEHQVTTLDMSGNANLAILESVNNPVTSINVSSNLNLDRLECPGNLLTQIDISNNVNLRNLDMTSNQLSDLDVNSNVNLEILQVGDNQLSDLDVSNNIHLLGLVFNHNTLTEIDVTHHPELAVLYCGNNELLTVDVSNNPELDFFDCSNNPLTSFSIKNGSLLAIFGFSGTPDLQYICADDFETSTVQAKITEYGYTNIVVNSACNSLGMENLASNQPTLFPNPAKSHVVIGNTPIGSALTITDLAGELVYEGIATSGESVVSTTCFLNGMYLVTISYNDKSVIKKLVIGEN